ncbi:hypothetical protein GQ43DRAFT_42859 [Delitschia confertaspora ATCC 74209]|uniref:Siderophore biosynthesis n=1 Tax=Delitschia confertaspora ATCC 74209 TaxID=1513339 RepID=A0A9P4JVR3_9PLEO|nr:hypothetical protein GQ43DRAFT_42859 [Delitschia confertaspora ATCC 74209]
MRSSAVFALALPLLAAARTDLAGCTSSVIPGSADAPWPHLLWYVPETGEICKIPDCGGGRAAPKKDNPACPNWYTGTETYTPSFIPGYGQAKATPTPVVTPTAAPAKETSIEMPAYGQSSAAAAASSSSSSVETPAVSTLSTSVLATITTPAQLSTSPAGSVGTVVFSSGIANSTAGHNNVTASTATPSMPEGTGAASALDVAGKAVFGLALGVAGFAML